MISHYYVNERGFEMERGWATFSGKRLAFRSYELRVFVRTRPQGRAEKFIRV